MSVNVALGKIGIVKSVTDDLGGERIQVAIVGTDECRKAVKDLPWCYPLLPMTLHVKPKINEKVLVFFTEPDNIYSDRFYIGPINSQIDKIEGETVGSLDSRKSSTDIMTNKTLNAPQVKGCFAKNDEVTVYGRKNTELILGDDYTSLRCDVRSKKDEKPLFNNTSSSYLTLHGGNKTSTATLVADHINLLGNQGSEKFPTDVAGGEMLSNQKLRNLIETAHKMPYGDILVEFMQEFVNAFMNHVHPYPGHVPDGSSEILRLKEHSDNLPETALSKSVSLT